MSTTRSPLPSLAMRNLTPILGAILLALAAAIPFAAGAPALAAIAQAQRVISSIATIEWDGPSGRVSQSSNKVEIALDPEPEATASASFYRFGAPAAARTSAFSPRAAR